MKKKILVFVILVFSASTIFLYQWFKFYDGKLHVVFCNVGQGDVIYIRTPRQVNILVDGGPSDKVLSCLSNHMPFWDKTLNLIVLTHPHTDHIIGLLSVLRRYQVMSFATENLYNDTVTFEELADLLKEKKIKTKYLFAGDRVKMKDGVVFDIVSPTREFLHSTSLDGKISESGEFGSLSLVLSYGKFKLLLTGDSQANQLQNIDFKVDVLQVPHHGSKTGLTDEIIQTLYPRLAVISVGKNKYGHPSREVIKILRDQDIRILRTDEKGDIEIIK